MRSVRISFFISIIYCGFLSAQSGSDSGGDKIVAQVDSLKITSEEFYYSYEYGPAFVKRKPGSKNRHLNYMINEKLLALDGYGRGVDKTGQANEILNEFVSDLATEELFKRDILSKIEIQPEEIDTILNKKQLELEIKWIYADSEKEITDYTVKMKRGIPFDSLFASQISDSVFYDERYMKINRYKLEQKNPGLAKIIDTMKAGEISLPVHADDGWYIVKLDNVQQNIITTETGYERLKQESVNALTKSKMDRLSDKYINELMVENDPVIKRNTFTFLRSYLGSYLLDQEKYREWNLTDKLNEAIKNLNIQDEKEYINAVLVEFNTGSFSINDFLTWYRNRSLYIKLNENDLQNFSKSLEGLIWRMIRDKLLSRMAAERGLDKLDTVVKQSGWWKDKVVSSIVKNEIAGTVMLENKEINTGRSSPDETASGRFSDEFTERLLRKILALKQKYSVSINDEVLEKIHVSVENDPKAVEFYTVKKGGLIPRTPYPTIDFEWINWE